MIKRTAVICHSMREGYQDLCNKRSLFSRLCSISVIKRSSHAVGHYALVPVIAKAAIAAGADGLLVEVHPTPRKPS